MVQPAIVSKLNGKQSEEEIGSGFTSLEMDLSEAVQARSLVFEFEEEPEVACCGVYPRRFPYKTKNGGRGCCGQKTFDVELLECCDISNSKSRLIGSC